MNLKQIIFITIVSYIIFISLVFCNAADITLKWDHDNPSDVQGYRVYKTETKGVYTYVKNDPINNDMIWEGSAMTCTVTVPDGPCEYWFVATAYDSLESVPSNEVMYSMKLMNIHLMDMSEDNFDNCLDRRIVDQPFTVCWDLCGDAIGYELKIAHYFYEGLETTSVETTDVCYTFNGLPKSSRHFEIKVRAIYPEGSGGGWGSSVNNGSPKNWLIYSKPATPIW